MHKKTMKLLTVIISVVMIITMIPANTLATEVYNNDIAKEIVTPEKHTGVFDTEFKQFMDEVARLKENDQTDGFVGSIIFTIGDTSILVDGRSKKIDIGNGASTIIIDDQIFLPLQMIVNEIGGTINSDADRQKVVISESGWIVELVIGSEIMILDGEEIRLESAPQIFTNTIMVPAGVICEGLGFEYHPYQDDVEQYIILTRIFQTKRLLVQSDVKMDFSHLENVEIINGPDNYAVMKFATIWEAKKVQSQLETMQGIILVRPDVFMPESLGTGVVENTGYMPIMPTGASLGGVTYYDTSDLFIGTGTAYLYIRCADLCSPGATIALALASAGIGLANPIAGLVIALGTASLQAVCVGYGVIIPIVHVLWVPTVPVIWDVRPQQAPMRTITWNANGGSVSPTTRNVRANSQIGTLPTPTRSGFSFAGWFTQQTGGTQIYSTSIMPNNNVIYYARWNPPITLTESNPSTVVIVTAGTTGRVPITITAPSKGSVTVQSSDLTSGSNPALYNAAGARIADDEAGDSHWRYIISAGQTMTIYAGTYSNGAASYRVTALFPGDCVVTFDFNDGGKTANVSVVIDNGVVPEPAGLERKGYTFLYWALNGVEFNFSNSIMSNITLIAQWKPVVYTIRYDLREGTNVANNPTTYSIVSSFPMVISNPNRVDYEFLGWTIKYFDDSQTDITTPILAYNIKEGTTGNIELTANWKPKQYDIIYNLNGGINAINNPAVYTKENVFPITITQPAKSGSDFLGWTVKYLNIDQADITTPTLSYSVSGGTTGNIELTANWKPKQFTVQFVNYDGVILWAEIVPYGNSATAPTINPTRNGYSFTGWDIMFNNVVSDLTVTAQYRVNNSSDDNTGHSGSSSNTSPSESSQSTPPNDHVPTEQADSTPGQTNEIETKTSWSLWNIALIAVVILIIVGAICMLLRKRS
jgi:uncharacterized repeat protein (TIGR02543 family)